MDLEISAKLRLKLDHKSYATQEEAFAKVGERDEVQGVRNTGGETYQ